MALELIRPALKYAEQVMEYKAEMIANHDNLDGCAGLEDVSSFEEWIDFENRLKQKYGNEYVPSEVFLCIRTEDVYQWRSGIIKPEASSLKHSIIKAQASSTPRPILR